MIRIRLEQARERYENRFQRRYTSEELSRVSRLLKMALAEYPILARHYAAFSAKTINQISATKHYLTSIQTLNTLCHILHCTPKELLGYTTIDKDIEDLGAEPTLAAQKSRGSKSARTGQRSKQRGGFMLEELDAVSRAIVGVIESSGFKVAIHRTTGGVRLTATSNKGDVAAVEGKDLFRAICELAESVGIDLEDGMSHGKGPT